MLVYGFIGDKNGFLEIENKLQDMQKIVGGRMERISLAEGIDLIVNEEYLFNGSGLRLFIFENDEISNVVMGDCFVCRNDKEGNFISIRREDFPILQECLLHINCDELRLLAAIYLSSLK